MVLNEKESSEDAACLWNKWDLPPPEEFVAQTSLNPKMRRKLLKIREDLFQIRNVLSNLHYLNAEGVTLSRLLYRFYHPLRKDKGYQLLKMIMSALKKYVQMNMVESIDEVRRKIPIRFLPFEDLKDLPTQAALGWMLAKFQGMAALFYRIFHLTKRAGLFIYQRLRLLWNPTLLVICLGLTARIHVISKYLVLQCVAWHAAIIPQVKPLVCPQHNLYKDYPSDLKSWLGGLEDLAKVPDKGTNTLDLVFHLIDLTQEDDNGLVEIIKDFNDRNEDDDDEVRRVFEMVDLVTPRKLAGKLEDEEGSDLIVLSDCESEDMGEVISNKNESEDIGEVIAENRNSEIVLSDENDEVVICEPALSCPQEEIRRKRKCESNEFFIDTTPDHNLSQNLKIKKRKVKKKKNAIENWGADEASAPFGDRSKRNSHETKINKMKKGTKKKSFLNLSNSNMHDDSFNVKSAQKKGKKRNQKLFSLDSSDRASDKNFQESINVSSPKMFNATKKKKGSFSGNSSKTAVMKNIQIKVSNPKKSKKVKKKNVQQSFIVSDSMNEFLPEKFNAETPRTFKNVKMKKSPYKLNASNSSPQQAPFKVMRKKKKKKKHANAIVP